MGHITWCSSMNNWKIVYWKSGNNKTNRKRRLREDWERLWGFNWKKSTISCGRFYFCINYLRDSIIIKSWNYLGIFNYWLVKWSTIYWQYLLLHPISTRSNSQNWRVIQKISARYVRFHSFLTKLGSLWNQHSPWWCLTKTQTQEWFSTVRCQKCWNG